MTQDFFFQALSASQAANIAIAVFFAALVGAALFFSHTATESLPDLPDNMRLAESELRHYATVHRTVRDRIDTEVDTRKRARLQIELRALKQSLDQTQESLEFLKGSPGSDAISPASSPRATSVAEESTPTRRAAHRALRSNLRALEATGARVIDAVMGIDLMMPQVPALPRPRQASYNAAQVAPLSPSRFMPSTSIALGSDLIP